MALARWTGADAIVEEVVQGSRRGDPTDVVGAWLEKSGERDVLLAMDAPLGWPGTLARELHKHQAGRPIETMPNDLFRRHTDRFVKEQVGKLPLDVGADRIARAGHAALAFLGRLERQLKTRIELAWSPSFSGIRAIEVYPAATLKVHGIPTRGYKAKDGMAKRGKVLEGLSQRLFVKAEVPAMEKRSDTLDAVACVLAGADFLRGHCYPPVKGAPVEKEGWIWVREKR